jgi:hypothetical protein
MSETEKLVSVGQPRLVRPLWMTGSKENDWIEDAAHENGQYFGKCLSCGTDFIGHKRRHACRKCQKASDQLWAAMSDTERQSELAKMAATIEAWQSSRTNDQGLATQPAPQMPEKHK